MVLKSFFDRSATQLTYAGLFGLAQTLRGGELAAFFRNSHVSVMYRRRGDGDGDGDEGGADALPVLYVLATDAALRDHETVVWESVADVDQAASEFFDGELGNVARGAQHAEAGGRARGAGKAKAEAEPGAGAGAGAAGRRADTGADAQLAQQLQEEEYGASEGVRTGGRGRAHAAAARAAAAAAPRPGIPPRTQHKTAPRGRGRGRGGKQCVLM